MPGLVSAGTHLESIFAAGSGSSDTGYVENGVLLANKYAPLSLGAAASAVGFTRNGTNLNAYYAGIGTTAADGAWPVGGGFIAGTNGTERFAFPGITILTGRGDWQYQNIDNSVSSTQFTSNLIGDRFNLCPGPANPNTNSFSTFGGFSNGARYGLYSGNVLRFECYTDALGGSGIWNVTVGAATEQYENWHDIHSGGVPLCENSFPYYNNPLNVFDFSPAAGTFYGRFTSYLYWARPNYWAVRFAMGFGINVASGSLNVIRVKVYRLS